MALFKKPGADSTSVRTRATPTWRINLRNRCQAVSTREVDVTVFPLRQLFSYSKSSWAEIRLMAHEQREALVRPIMGRGGWQRLRGATVKLHSTAAVIRTRPGYWAHRPLRVCRLDYLVIRNRIAIRASRHCEQNCPRHWGPKSCESPRKIRRYRSAPARSFCRAVLLRVSRRKHPGRQHGRAPAALAVA